MDVLEAHKDAIEQALYFRLAHLFNLDVELIFYETTSLPCAIDDVDQGVGDEDLVEGSLAAGSKTYQAPRNLGLSKNGRGDAPQIVVGLAVTRDGLPVRHWVFPGHTVDVSTVAQVKDDLRGWQLNRCVFVGDAGMVSQENLTTLGESGGKYILCRPMRRGDEVTREVLQRPGSLSARRGQPAGQGSRHGRGGTLSSLCRVSQPPGRETAESPSSAAPAGTRS